MEEIIPANKVKILFTIRQGEIGGGETHVLELAKNMDREKFQIHVLAFSNGQMVDTLKEIGIHTHIINSNKPFDFRVWKKVYNLAKKLNIDIIHAHGTRACSNSFYAAKRLKAKFIYTVHGWSFHKGLSKLVYWARVFSESYLTKRADVTINVGHSDQEDGKSLFNLSNSNVILNGINVGKYNSLNNVERLTTLKQKLNIPQNAFIIGMVARITYQKDPETFIRAIPILEKNIPNAHYLMVGDGDLMDNMVSLSEKLGVSNKIVFTGFRNDIPDLLRLMDVYCLTSLWEGLPIGLLEAMASGKAIVSTGVNGSKEIISDQENGLFFNIGDHEDLSNKISILYKNKAIFNKISTNALATVKERYEVEKMADEVEKVYTNVLNNKSNVIPQKKLRIGIEAQRIFRRKKHGLEVVAVELINALQKIDTHNEYVIFVKDDEDQSCIRETENFKIKVLKSYPYPIWEQFVLPRQVKKEKLDLLHCTSNTAPIFCSTPIVLTLHDIIFLESLNFAGSLYQNLGNIYRRLLLPRIINKCKSVLTVSNFEREKIINRLKLSPDIVHTVYNGKNNVFNSNNNPNGSKSIAQKYNLPEKYILFFGNKAPKKNTKRTLMGYFHYVKKTDTPLPLVVLDCEKDYLRDLVGSEFNKLQNHVIVKDYIKNQDMPGVYSSAELFLYTSLRESFGMPILESMACGTPVITSNNSSMLEIANGAGVLADPFNHVDIGEKIISFLGETENQNQWVNLGYERASKFDWDKNAKLTLSIYKNLIHSFKEKNK